MPSTTFAIHQHLTICVGTSLKSPCLCICSRISRIGSGGNVFSTTNLLKMVRKLAAEIRDKVVDICSHTKNQTIVIPSDLEQRDGEVDGDYVKRVKSLVEDLLARNATFASNW